jgi:hypothetical protein
MPFATYGDEYRSNNTFADYRSALKDAKNKNFFRAKLLTNCQTEFQNSTMNVRARLRLIMRFVRVLVTI